MDFQIQNDNQINADISLVYISNRKGEVLEIFALPEGKRKFNKEINANNRKCYLVFVNLKNQWSLIQCSNSGSIPCVNPQDNDIFITI